MMQFCFVMETQGLVKHILGKNSDPHGIDEMGRC